MRKYEPYIARAGYAFPVVLSGHPDHDWCEANLVKTPWYKTSGITGETTRHGDIIFYSIHWLPDGNRLYSYKSAENKRRVIEQFPELVVEADPEGPDRCPDCGGPERPPLNPAAHLPGWLCRLLGIRIAHQ